MSRLGYMTGGKSALWKDEDMTEMFLNAGTSFLDANWDHPFFPYFVTHDIHVPRLPNPRFAGKTTMGPREDAIAELDWTANCSIIRRPGPYEEHVGSLLE